MFAMRQVGFNEAGMEFIEREEEIRLIAYQTWEEEGRPHGRDLDHWLKAEAIWQERQGQELLAGPSAPSAQSAKDQSKRGRSKARPSRAKAK